MELTSLILILATLHMGVAEVDDTHKEALEAIHRVNSNMDQCVPGTGNILSIAFDHQKWDDLAKIAVRTANIVSQLLIAHDNALFAAAPEFLFDLVISTVSEFSIYGSAIAFEEYVYPDYQLFSPYAYQTDKIYSFDLSLGYNYLPASWFNVLRSKSWDDIHFSTAEVKYRWNSTHHDTEQTQRSPTARLEDGYWTLPYFDCGGGDTWMITYSAPIFGVDQQQRPVFKGVATIDIDLSNIDINQCDAEDELHISVEEFRGTHHCQPTTQCERTKGEGFVLGSYRCECMHGFYFPDASASRNYYDGKHLDEYFDGSGESVDGGDEHRFQCNRCAPGCAVCDDESPCQEWNAAAGIKHSYITLCIFAAASLLLR